MPVGHCPTYPMVTTTKFKPCWNRESLLASSNYLCKLTYISLPPLSHLYTPFTLRHSSVAIKTPALRTIGNLVTGDDIQTQVVLDCNVLSPLLALLNSSKKAIKKEACWTVSNIAAGNKSQIQTIINADMVPSLIRLLGDAEYDVKREAAFGKSFFSFFPLIFLLIVLPQFSHRQCDYGRV